MNKFKIIFIVILICQFDKYSWAQVPTTWTVNPSAYTYQMSVTTKANEACVDLTDANNYVAAFVAGQCRGVIKTNTAVGPNMLGLMTIKSNVVSGEKVSFQIYKASSNTVLNVLDSVVFSQGASVGTLSSPFTLFTNHAPTDITISNYTITENTVLGTPIATLSTTDQDNTTTFNYSLTATKPENIQFSITGNQLAVNANFDYETDSIKVIELAVNDNGGCSYFETFTITVIDGNDAPLAINLSSPLISDHQQLGSFMGEFSTIDNDLNDAHTYSLVSGSGNTDNAQFYIQNDTLYNVSQLDYTIQSIYYIRARSTDLGGLFIENTFTINVSNINDAPNNILLNNFLVDENLPVASTIGTLSVIDNDLADTHTLSIASGLDSVAVTIIGNILQTNKSYNFEQKDSLFVNIKATDPYSAYVIKTFTIVINDINDAPTNITLFGDSVYESQPVSTPIGTFSTTDEDMGATHSYSLTAGNGDTDNGLFLLSNNQLLSNTTYTYTGQQYSIRVKSTDMGGQNYEKIFLITVLNTNESPTDIVIDTTIVKEDNKPLFYVSKIKTIDPDQPDYFTYALVSGAGDEDNAEFIVQNNSLFILEKTMYDVKSSYNFRIKTTDLGGLNYEKSFVLEVKDISGNSIPLPSTNYVSPNGDGKNDFWKVENIEIYKDFELKIFDQFGQVIYNVPNNYNNEFDGIYKGKTLPTGNYYYIFQKDQKQFKGNITIVN